MDNQEKDLEKVKTVTAQKPFLFSIECRCGEAWYVQNESNWQFRFIGVMAFKCPRCGQEQVFRNDSLF